MLYNTRCIINACFRLKWNIAVYLSRWKSVEWRLVNADPLESVVLVHEKSRGTSSPMWKLFTYQARSKVSKKVR